MGILFGALFSRAGAEVSYLDRNPKRAHRLSEKGLTLFQGDAAFNFKPAIAASPEILAGADLLLAAVKAYDTPGLAREAARHLPPAAPVLTLQNGIGGADIFGGIIGSERVVVGVTAQGATLLKEGVALHGGNGATVIGPFVKGAPAREDVLDLFAKSGLAASWQDPVWPAVWKKLAANAGINAVTALTNVKNLAVAENPHARAVCVEAVVETARVAKAEGTDLGNPEELSAWVVEVARATGRNRSSMGQDVDRGSPTEIEFINGAVSRLGESHGIETPVNLTLARLVRALEKCGKR